MQVGEFVEVFNNSEDDPAAWLARVSKVLADDHYNVRMSVQNCLFESGIVLRGYREL